MKKLHLALTLLICATTMPAQTPLAPPAHPIVEYAVKLFMAGMSGYIIYDIGKMYGWWAYPTAEELFGQIGDTTKKIEEYQDLIDVYLAAEDTTKEEMLHIMASNVNYVKFMHNTLYAVQRLLKKIDGRMCKMRSAEGEKDEAAIAQLEHHAAMLQVQVDLLEQMIAHSNKHADYFKLYALEQAVVNKSARELQLYERYQDDLERLQTEMLNYSSYAYRQRFGLLTLRTKLYNLRTECEYGLVRYARAYPRLKAVVEQRIDALYQLEAAIKATAYYINLDAEHEKLLAQPDEERYNILNN